ncbi:unnamed protein product [Spirodela intermedia]|uniref:Uncharacterized protein n=1 Tax=Spirodela intermedia TaxID=51605 RepID=A0A7I8J7F0_SPIIN|nr:unnamed protein product [Spirodela intermedia]CAA6666178.1 unnamed protein product [Spirodela intermedia]
MEALIRTPYEATVKAMLASLERNLLPDMVVRQLTRLLLASRLRSGTSRLRSSSSPTSSTLLAVSTRTCRGELLALDQMPIAVETEKPKAQHYELPTSFFKLVLGKNLKYSSCYFLDKSNTLDDAEDQMLEMYCTRAQIKDGQSILDVGCGWGSFSLYIAKKHKNCNITGICNSLTQKAHIEERCRELQLSNVSIIVADISKFEMEASFDRVVSIEMFEHMKNYKVLLKKISGWMKEDSLLLYIISIFLHGGTMPSANLLLYFQDDVTVVDHWLVNGKHYAQTSEEWLNRMDENSLVIRPIMESTYGKAEATKWTVYWRTFFIAVAELFGYNNGEEWMVAHFLFKKK